MAVSLLVKTRRMRARLSKDIPKKRRLTVGLPGTNLPERMKAKLRTTVYQGPRAMDQWSTILTTRQGQKPAIILPPVKMIATLTTSRSTQTTMKVWTEDKWCGAPAWRLSEAVWTLDLKRLTQSLRMKS